MPKIITFGKQNNESMSEISEMENKRKSINIRGLNYATSNDEIEDKNMLSEYDPESLKHSAESLRKKFKLKSKGNETYKLPKELE